MSDDRTDINLSELELHIAEQSRWATLSVSVQEIADDNKSLVSDLSSYNPATAIPLLASLLTLPEYQSQCIRLEILVTLAIVFCEGRKRANIGDTERWFSQIGKSRCVVGEDPTEDIFVSLVHDQKGNYRLLEGVWEGAGFYTQRVLEVVSTMPDKGVFEQIKRSFFALLNISDMVCEKAGLHRYQRGSDVMNRVLSPNNIPEREELISHVLVTFKELNERGITLNDIEPFICYPQLRESLPAQQIGCSHLDRHPLIVNEEKDLTVALPSALSVAARDFIITAVFKGKLVEVFNDELAKSYTSLLINTPLLGGSTPPSINWKQLGSHRLSDLDFEFDQGYFVSYKFFLTSVETHGSSGFKSAYIDGGDLTAALQKSISDTLKEYSQLPGFKGGVVVMVGCGCGKGYVIDGIEMGNPKWHFQDISVADLVRLSWLNGMNPSYIWRIQDGHKAIANSGVHIVNQNGILNLIGWVRENKGHFVPHSQLPEGTISPDRPLILSPPLNLLREVRIESDVSYDRHHAMNHIGIRQDVQRESPNPYFVNECRKHLYVSMDEIARGKLVSLYEGESQLWLSVGAPNITNREIVYRLWEMANEWLCRIGNQLDKDAAIQSVKQNLRVYVEFQDFDLPKRPGIKPAPDELFPLCTISKHKERGAIKLTFKSGFLRGFGIAENIAERLFVFNLTCSYLKLLGIVEVEKEARAITNSVVINKEARSFHLFHAQSFLDYVLDTLPKKLVTNDQIDDAAMKIGLGWRVIGSDQDCNIKGREACTKFLNKAIDVLLSEIQEMLVTFERVSTLIRLVANVEKASAEKNHWERTSAAVIGLHEQDKTTIDRYVEQISKFNGASIASRVLIEIALCACPSNDGVQLSHIELSKLIARASFIVQIGGLSNAIYYNALSPEIRISPLGDILFRDDFGELVVQPTLNRALGEQFVANAPMQRKNYDEPKVDNSAQDKIDEEFCDIWSIETGFSLDEARNIISALEDRAIRDHIALLNITKSEYLSTVCSDGVVLDSAEKFLEQFTLSTRKRWSKPPDGFEIDDIEPWRFGRRLSFVTRPILKVSEDDDPQLIIAPSALRQGFAYVVGGAHSGRFKQSFFQSKAMRDTWWGKASEGHSFNNKVAQSLSEAGWQVRENIELSELFNQKTEQDFGDVDVLAWKPDQKEVLVIECKDISFARNYSEMAALLSSYQGKDNASGKPDKLKMHLRRIALLENNLDKLRCFTGIHKPVVVSCLVCSGIVPMQYAKIDALTHTHVGTIEDIKVL